MSYCRIQIEMKLLKGEKKTRYKKGEKQTSEMERKLRKIEKEQQSTIAVLPLALPSFFFFDFARDIIPKLATNYIANEGRVKERQPGRERRAIRRIAFIIRLQDSQRERGSCEHDTRQ